VLFSNSTYAAISGDVFCVVSCAFKDTSNFNGFVTFNKCEVWGADLLGS
jgi:hypothetical protein